MRPSKLPEQLEQAVIADMLTGEDAYTLPWAIQVDTNGDMYIRGDYPAMQAGEHPNGRLRIRRTTGGIQVWRSSIPQDSRYSPHDVSHAVRCWRALPVELV